MAVMGLSWVPRPARADDQQVEEGGITMYKTGSGLKYIELKPGKGPSPQYGQLCAIQYTGYLKLPNDAKPQKFDSNSFLIKHGNGRTIAGLDEGIHTMKVGGIRRLIIPPKLGYVDSGLGPVPEMPWNRWSLNNLLSRMVDQRGGNLVFEVELTSVIDDEASQGYYDDLSPTPEEFDRLRRDFQERAVQERAAAAAITENGSV
jgi:FKBP-type peptidyl-prolyl cis-trans isomerase